MPTARPIITSTLTTTKLRTNAWPMPATTASATTMPATATAIGTTAATTPPKTATRTIRASASPNCSPRARSSSAASLKSASIDSSPTISARNPSCPSAATTRSTTGSTSRPSSTSSSALWWSWETGPARTSLAPAARKPAASELMRRSKRGSSALRLREETITASSTRKPRSPRTGGKARLSTCSARWASGRPVKSSSVVTAEPSSPAIAAAEATTASIQPPITSHLRRVLARASRSVRFLTRIPSSVLVGRIGRRHAPAPGSAPPDGQWDSWATGWPVVRRRPKGAAASLAATAVALSPGGEIREPRAGITVGLRMRRVSGRRTVVTGNDRSSDTRALELQAALEIPFERAQIQLRAGVVLAASGKRDLALEQLVDAYRTVRRLGSRESDRARAAPGLTGATAAKWTPRALLSRPGDGSVSSHSRARTPLYRRHPPPRGEWPMASSRDKVLELVVFKLKEGISHERLLATGDAVSSWIKQQHGFISRELSYDAEGDRWIDLVWWRTIEDAQTAAAAAMTSASCAPMFACSERCWRCQTASAPRSRRSRRRHTASGSNAHAAWSPKRFATTRPRQRRTITASGSPHGSSTTSRAWGICTARTPAPA